MQEGTLLINFTHYEHNKHKTFDNINAILWGANGYPDGQ